MKLFFVLAMSLCFTTVVFAGGSCDEPVMLDYVVVEMPDGIYGFVFGDTDCDNKCDAVVVALYVGQCPTTGQALFTPLVIISCEEANEILSQVDQNTKRLGI
jgi:hypothetical protein